MRSKFEMAPVGNPNSGLLFEILLVMRTHGQSRTYDSDWLTQKVRESGYWEHRTAQTPERSVNRYLNENKQLFQRIAPNRFRLHLDSFTVDDNPPCNDDGLVAPPKIETTVYRTLRDTELIRRLKIIHDHQCQICGLRLALDETGYSEGHHIQPLGKGGPDVPGNILILCPNHHVLCDFLAIPINGSELRTDSRHKLDQQFIDWHNERITNG